MIVAGIAVACGGVSACGAASPDKGDRSATASASPTKKGPGGPGGRLFGGIWTFDERSLTVDGQEVHGPEFSSPWVEFRDDGTVAGDYGCTSFRMKAELEATTLTLGEDVPVLPAPSATPAPPEKIASCPTPQMQQNDIASSTGPDAQKPKAEDLGPRSPELKDFEAKVKKFFHRGQLKITEKKLERQPGGPPPGSLPQLRNEHGDVATLTIVRSPDIFDTKFRLDGWEVYDSSDNVKSAKDTSFEFHRDGTVTGKLGCNDFTAKVFFNGSHVFFHDTQLTTHRTCAAQNMEDEAAILRALKRSLNYRYAGGSEWIHMRDDVGSEYRATGLRFRSATDQ
ncbi:META domain-containing protein [Streptomyces kasugaensis]|uniref:META domain-containing protein n=1 Tax=Streptomyces kasugaensis TaxID=1946 RepID=UPI0015590595|nr:META domain-containing protein [Streptomyces kasugaensis]